MKCSRACREILEKALTPERRRRRAYNEHMLEFRRRSESALRNVCDENVVENEIHEIVRVENEIVVGHEIVGGDAIDAVSVV
ncbi:hypothetical protein HDU79_002012, partial [Rhizoclosmatium sp. JEL0117]